MRRATVATLLLFVMMFITACNTITPVSPTETVERTTAAPTRVPPTATPTAVPTEVPKDLVLTGRQGTPRYNSVVHGHEGIFLFEVENPNSEYAIEGSTYQVELFDKNGFYLDTLDGNYAIPLVLPGEKKMVAFQFRNNYRNGVGRIDIQLSSADPEPLALKFPAVLFEVSQVDLNWNSISGTVTSNLDQMATDVHIIGVGYNADGEIIAGGFEILEYLPPHHSIDVEVPLHFYQEPTSAEIYVGVLSNNLQTIEGEGFLELQGYGFGRIKDDVRILNPLGPEVIFTVQNTGISPLLNSKYVVKAYSSTGTLLASQEGLIDVVYPGEIQARTVELEYSGSQKISKAVVSIEQGFSAVPPLPDNPVTAEKARYYNGQNEDYVTAVIHNAIDQTIENVPAVAVGYDANGNIIGGGSALIQFVPAQGKTGVMIDYEGTKDPAAVEVYVYVSDASRFRPADDNGPLELIAQGYGEVNNILKAGYMVRNNSSDRVIETTGFQMIAYDSDGYVLDVKSPIMGDIFPQQETLYRVDFHLPDPSEVASVEMQMLTGIEAPSSVSENPFSVEDVTVAGYEKRFQVTGVVTSSLDHDVRDLGVNTVAYDAQGNIVGMGYQYVDNFPANGRKTVKVETDVWGEPDRFEMWAFILDLEP